MKKFICAAMALVMSMSMLTACGCTRNVENRTESVMTEATGMMPHVTTTVPTHTTEHTRGTEPSTGHTGTNGNVEGFEGGTEHTGTTDTTGSTGNPANTGTIGRSANMP